jgi:hypothetical protein
LEKFSANFADRGVSRGQRGGSPMVIKLGDNIDTVNKNTQTLIDASKGIGLEVNLEKKTKYMFVFHYQNVGQNRDIKNGEQII